MTIKQFSPKGEDVLKKEAIAFADKHLSHLEDEDKEKIINKMVADNLKNENFKAGEKTNTENANKRAKEMKDGKEYWKTKGGFNKSKGTNQDKGSDDELISPQDEAYLYGDNMKMKQTEVRHLKKVMKLTGKPWRESLNDGLYKTWKKGNDELITKQGSGLPASTGGEGVSDNEMTKKFSHNMPKAFRKPKKD